MVAPIRSTDQLGIKSSRRSGNKPFGFCIRIIIGVPLTGVTIKCSVYNLNLHWSEMFECSFLTTRSISTSVYENIVVLLTP